MPTNIEIASEIEILIESWRMQLLELDQMKAHSKPNANRWSISEVIGHLVDSACNNHQRFVRAQYCSDFVFPKYEQNEWVSAGNYQGSDWESLIELWYHYNRLIVRIIRNMHVSILPIPCTITPYETCTLGFLVKDYLDHMKHHLDILDVRLRELWAT